MAAVLGIHKADLKVISVYEGSVIIDFEVIENLFAEIPIVLEEVQATFETAAVVMETFMGASVLGAVSATIVVVTPNTPLNEDGSILAEFINIWEEPVDPSAPIIEDDIKVEVRYRVSSTDDSNNTRESGRVAFVAILACILVIAGLIIFSVFLYRKIVSSEPVDKAFVPDKIQKQEEFEQMDVLEEQYTPYKVVDNLFGGNKFDRSSTAKLTSGKNVLFDDSVKTISGLQQMQTTQREKAKVADDVKEHDDLNQSPDFQPKKKTTRKKTIV